MTKISNKSSYPVDNSLSGKEFLVGTDDGGQTKSYTIEDLAALVLELDPNNLDTTPITITERVFNIPVDDESDVDAINNGTQFSVGIREICILTSNSGDVKYLLKSGSGIYGLNQTQITSSDLIVIFDIREGVVSSVNGESGDVNIDIKVASVTGDGVDNTDPNNPVLSFPEPLDIDAAPLINGIIPTQYLPGTVDEILEYADYSSFPSTGLVNKIYLDLSSNIPYRWGGNVYVPLSGALVLGNTSATAHRGDHGSLAYSRSTYTNTTPVPSDVGGVEKDSIFLGKPIPEILDQLLYPYQYPAFSSFSITSGISGQHEVGEVVSTGLNSFFNISADNSDNISNITINQSGPPLYSQVAFSSTIGPIPNTTFLRNTVGSVVMYTLSGLNTRNQNIDSISISSNWLARIYYGKSEEETLDEQGLESLSGTELVSSIPLNNVKTALGGSGFLHVAIPTALIGDIGDIYDEGGANNVPKIDYSVSVTNQHGLNVDYKVYRSSFSFSGTEYKFQLK